MTMADNLPARVEDVIANRIRAQFVELIPEEAFTMMVKKEIDWFTSTRSGQYYDGGRDQISPLQNLIRKDIERKFVDLLGAELSKPEYQPTIFNANGVPQMGDAVRAIIKECMPEIVAAAWGSTFQSAIMTLRNSLPRI